MTFRKTLSALCGVALLGTVASAQFNNQWVEFNRDDGRLAVSPSSVSNSTIEVDFAWADLDQDTFTDLVVVRKQPFTSNGKRTNLLFMNEGGTLVDRTTEFASASDVPGGVDNGFNTATNDRDVVISDVDEDGWLDVVTATTLSGCDPKWLGHPRIYMNQGEDGGGAWQGLLYEEARIPQIFTDGGSPENPRFCGVDAGDVTNNGFDDLYFSDYDTGFDACPADTNDRLFINDGFGFFSDESSLRMTVAMLTGGFGTSVYIGDFNLDGANDVLQNESGLTDLRYNDPENVGTFNLLQNVWNSAPYHTSAGDLNNDGRLDVVHADDSSDRYNYNLGNDGLGQVQWGPAKTFQFLSGGDDGFGSNVLITDLDTDGWNDVIITDIDVDIGGDNRRIHVYHNPGGPVGSQITLVEERQQSGGGGWLGAAGLTQGDLQGGHDVAVFDLDNDGDQDMVLGRSSGTFVWMNQTEAVGVWANLGNSLTGTGGVHPTLQGEGELLGNDPVSFIFGSMLPDSTLTFFIGLSAINANFKGGTLVPAPTFVIGGLPTGPTGELTLNAVWPSGVPGDTTLYYQGWVADPGAVKGLSATNAISGTTPDL